MTRAAQRAFATQPSKRWSRGSGRLVANDAATAASSSSAAGRAIRACSHCAATARCATPTSSSPTGSVRPSCCESLPPEVEVIDVGKTPRGEATSQEDINDLLVRRAKAGDVVVRLKGGDPFVLGRGGEEVAACAAAGVEVEVVPGVTSAIAAPTLAGVPLTRRGTAQEFTVASGHVPPGDPRSTVDWQRLGAGNGTIVLLMAVAYLRPIADTLITAGRAAQTPAVVIENASLPQQRIVRTTLATLADDAEAQQRRPAGRGRDR